MNQFTSPVTVGVFDLQAMVTDDSKYFIEDLNRHIPYQLICFLRTMNSDVMAIAGDFRRIDIPCFSAFFSLLACSVDGSWGHCGDGYPSQLKVIVAYPADSRNSAIISMAILCSFWSCSRSSSFSLFLSFTWMSCLPVQPRVSAWCVLSSHPKGALYLRCFACLIYDCRAQIFRDQFLGF